MHVKFSGLKTKAYSKNTPKLITFVNYNILVSNFSQRADVVRRDVFRTLPNIYGGVFLKQVPS